MHQLLTAQPVCCCQIQEGEVPPSKRFGAVDGLNERLHLGPGKRAWQTLPAVHPWGVDLQMQRPSQCSLCVALFEISAKRRNNMLHTEAVVSPRCLSKEGLNLVGFKSP